MAIISPRLKEVIQEQPGWYQDAEFLALYNQLMGTPGDTENPLTREETWEVINFFAQALMAGEVRLLAKGEIKPGFNDDDRPGRFAGAQTVPTDTVVVHHTAVEKDPNGHELTVWQLEALGLLRLYLPQFITPGFFLQFLRDTNPQLADQETLAPASGHFEVRDGKEVQSFVGYHYIIYPDGRVVKLLEHDQMGFHAGNLSVNKRSLGVSLVGDFSGGEPTAAAQESLKSLIKKLDAHQLQLQYLVGHSEVRKGEKTECPGEWFEEFRKSADLTHLRAFAA